MSDDAQRTRPSLLLRLREPGDSEAWRQFVEIYTPVIYGFCRKRDLQDADASDVCQEVMRSVARTVGHFEYDPSRGKFRYWLLTVLRSKLNDFFAGRQRRPDPTGDTHLLQLADAQPSESEQSDWDAEYHRRLFLWAAKRIEGEFHEKTWKAFWETAVEQCDGKEVAARVGLSLGAVYVAKSRVLARLRQEIQSVEGQGAGGFRGASGAETVSDQ